MAHESPSPRRLHQELHRPQGHTIKGEDRFRLHPLANSALLRHLRRRTLDSQSIIHIDCSLRDCAYPVVQDTEINIS